MPIQSRSTPCNRAVLSAERAEFTGAATAARKHAESDAGRISATVGRECHETGQPGHAQTQRGSGDPSFSIRRRNKPGFIIVTGWCKYAWHSDLRSQHSFLMLQSDSYC